MNYRSNAAADFVLQDRRTPPGAVAPDSAGDRGRELNAAAIRLQIGGRIIAR
jgi:hypothetical protein